MIICHIHHLKVKGRMNLEGMHCHGGAIREYVLYPIRIGHVSRLICQHLKRTDRDTKANKSTVEHPRKARSPSAHDSSWHLICIPHITYKLLALSWSQFGLPTCVFSPQPTTNAQKLKLPSNLSQLVYDYCNDSRLGPAKLVNRQLVQRGTSHNININISKQTYIY